MEAQIELLLESVGELDNLVEGLTRRVEALEEPQSLTEAPAETPRDEEAGSEGRHQLG